MIFQPDAVDAILAGRKRVTRRLTSHRGGRPLKYREGGVYAVQPGRGQHHVAHIIIRAVDVMLLGDLPLGEAALEGFASVQAFEDAWCQLHGEYDPKVLVARIEFGLADRCDDCRFW